MAALSFGTGGAWRLKVSANVDKFPAPTSVNSAKTRRVKYSAIRLSAANIAEAATSSGL